MFTDFKINPTAYGEKPKSDYIEVDVIASFNRHGQFRPAYVKRENEDGENVTYKVARIIQEKDSRISGLDRTVFFVTLELEDKYKNAEMIYMHENRTWYMK